MGRLKAVIFDFDGLILGTEETQLTAWQEIFREHGAELTLAEWSVCIGTFGAFDEVTHLEKLIGRPVDRAAVRADFKGREAALLAGLNLLPGVRDRLDEALASGIRRAIASSSETTWVEPHLARHGIRHLFEAVVVRNEHLPAKPRPDIYLAALAALGVTADEAVAFEDSMNGILAAKAAGIYCVAVPNAVTRDLDLTAADRRVESLAHLTLAELAQTSFANGRNS
jgi:HAD superfamily hydrolase (TIGR01509 family)